MILLPGCYESFTASPRDGGVVLDGALDGGSVPPDGDSGATSSACISGEIVSEYEGPGCSETTVACLATCSEPTAPPDCTTQCIERDPECRECVNESLVVCANAAGCQTAWNVFACCAEQRCPAIPGGAGRLACPFMGQCLVEADEYLACLEGALAACDEEVQRCFGAP